jgi:hypothetical protein
VDPAQLVLVLISCVMFVLVVSTLARAASGRSAGSARVVHDLGGEGWMDVNEVAALLETDPDEIINLVDRDAIPYFVGGRRAGSSPTTYWFRRDEIDDWVIGGAPR